MTKKNNRMMMTEFDKFINEQYKLTIEDSMDDFDVQNEAPWTFTYDVSDVWKRYNQIKDDDKFLNEYKNILLSKKDILINISKGCWNDLVELTNEKKTTVLPYLDKIYDWADKYGIKITAEKNGKNI